MKNLLIGILSCAVWCGVSVAQDQTPTQNPVPQTRANPQSSPSAIQPQNQQNTAQTGAQTPSNSTNGTPRIAPGSIIPVQLTKTVDAKKAKSGDEIDAKVTQDMKSNTGEVLVPKDTKVIGHVTEAQARNKEQKESQVAITFDHAVMKNGEDVKLPMSIQAIIAPASLNPGNNANANSAPSSEPTGAAGGASGGRAMPNTGAQQPQQPAPDVAGNDSGAAKQPQRPTITAQTQGVVGMSSDVKLAAAPDATRGSVVSSEKNNVKLENGTVMLLRVSQ